MIMTKATAICTGMKIPSGKVNFRSYSLSRDASMMLHHNTLASHISSVRKSTMHLHYHLQWQNDAFAYFCWYWRNCFVVVEKFNHIECVWWAKVKKVNKQMKKGKHCAGLQCELGQRRETRSAWVGGSEAAAVGEWRGPLLRNSFLNTWNPIQADPGRRRSVISFDIFSLGLSAP